MTTVESEAARLAAVARALGAAIAAAELQWEVHDDDDGFYWLLDVCVILATPGPTSSAYWSRTLASFRAEEPGERARASEIATVLASDLGVEAWMPDLQNAGGKGGSRWIEAHPAAAPALYGVRWDAYTWADDGERVDESGETTMSAMSGHAACNEVGCLVRARLDATVRPVFDRTSIPGMVVNAWWHRAPSRRPGVPSPDELRTGYLDGCGASALIETIQMRCPTATALDVMRSFEEAFHLGLDSLGPVAAWCNHRIDRDQLERTVGAAIAARQATWDRPRRLRAARARDHSLAAMLRVERDAGAGTIELIQSLRAAFGIGLADAKCAVVGLGTDDATLDAELAAAIVAARPRTI